MELREVRLSDGLVAPLLSGLEQEYRSRYGNNDEMRRVHVEEFDPPGGAFLVVVDGAVTAAGGGFRAHTAGVCEASACGRTRSIGAWDLPCGSFEPSRIVSGSWRLVGGLLKLMRQ
jgi:hypothetical protein